MIEKTVKEGENQRSQYTCTWYTIRGPPKGHEGYFGFDEHVAFVAREFLEEKNPFIRYLYDNDNEIGYQIGHYDDATVTVQHMHPREDSPPNVEKVNIQIISRGNIDDLVKSLEELFPQMYLFIEGPFVRRDAEYCE